MSQHGGQTYATCWAQQCGDMLRWHAAIVWPGLNITANGRMNTVWFKGTTSCGNEKERSKKCTHFTPFIPASFTGPMTQKRREKYPGQVVTSKRRAEVEGLVQSYALNNKQI